MELKLAQQLQEQGYTPGGTPLRPGASSVETSPIGRNANTSANVSASASANTSVNADAEVDADVGSSTDAAVAVGPPSSSPRPRERRPSTEKRDLVQGLSMALGHALREEQEQRQREMASVLSESVSHAYTLDMLKLNRTDFLF